ncbi:preprotein translocase subunit SecD [Natrarchaeobaculum sulfurireducens]|uniref:Protein-export membrane protein SecD n=1 Tax=Natrarchaeobaculum sulfurireducens TaxID=2044521 RepID=A0A346PIA5_9EURY|nr:preprotein translocase subunit SecD [Natrarchaeobaculum sulfurireducens]AXR79250.1 Preprotein translocase subunit SecD [Natrarchaeobaculum sulfurireducens]AXR80672.1 Protein-export membrane protein SecD [Natrarchaeobaculum sulfurireducens]
MGVKAFLKEYWRLIMIVSFVGFALVALFIPGGIIADESIADDDAQVDETLTNLEYGLGLDGGSRVAAPPVGIMADNLEIEPGDEHEVESVVLEYDYDEADLEAADTRVRYDEDNDRFTAEIFSEDVSHAEFADALQEAGLEVTEGDIEDGVTQQTRDEIIETIDLRINEGGLDGGQVYQEATIGGQYYIVTEVPGMDPDELRDLLTERGDVRIVAYHPDDDGNQTNTTVLQNEEIADPGSASYDDQQGQHYVPISVDDTEGEDGTSPAHEYQSSMSELGFTGEGMGQCTIHDREAGQFDFDPDDPQWCLLTVVDDDVVDAHSMSQDLGGSMESGEWVNSPSFRMIVPTQQDAYQLSVNLNSGALTAPLDFSQEQTYSLQPALADQFKVYSLIIGAFSILTVAGMIFLRYRNPKVAVPMILTASAEVVILLGFAALIRMPLDLSHVAGFIAVVGTGVDDLVIIADEVMDDGEVNSRRVFESRFRKAFWIIGAAAATTIIALSPLAVLSLGDLRGFAIITILGVLIGVLVTRPAYGDILQRLLTDK